MARFLPLVAWAFCVWLSPTLNAQSWTEEIPSNLVFWSANHEQGLPGEAGGLSQWHDLDAMFPRGGIFNTGQPPEAEVVAQTNTVFSGNYALRTTIQIPSPGNARAVRLMRWGDMGWDQGNSQALPQEAYYSAWYYFPNTFDPPVWWNIFQFKAKENCSDNGSDPILAINVYHDDADGEMCLYFWHSMLGQSFDQITPQNPVALPTNRWVHLETFYKQSTANTGVVKVWQDGVLIIDATNIPTMLSCPESLVWGLGNYTDEIQPNPATIYIDEALISSERAFPHAPVFLRGDVNQDGSVTIADPVAGLAAVFGNGPQPLCWKALDTNDDGGADVADPVYTLTFLFQNGPAPMAPHLTCGLDPTPDSVSCEGFGSCP